MRAEFSLVLYMLSGCVSRLRKRMSISHLDTDALLLRTITNKYGLNGKLQAPNIL